MRDLVNRTGQVVLARPWTTILLMLCIGLGAASLASQLSFDTRFDALLPDDAPELLEVRELQKRAGGTVRLILALGGKKEARLPFARRLVTRLRKTDFIQHADVEYPVEFFLDRRLYFLTLEQLGRLQADLDREIHQAKARANPFYVDLDDEPASAPAKGRDNAAFSALADPSHAHKGKALLKRTFESPDGRYLFVRIKPKGSSFDMAAGAVVYAKIRALVDSLDPAGQGLSVRYAGALPVNQEQNERMNSDLTKASAIALVLILILMTLYVRKIEAPLVLALPLVVGVSITLAITELMVGQLNLVSGFLVSALFGLGIDFEIHLYLRYLEELSDGRPRRVAMERAISKTIMSCTTAATTTAAAFFAIAISDFRGFREYGLIAGTGILVTLATTFVMLPPLATLLTGSGKRGLRLFAGSVFRRRFAFSMATVGGLFLAYSLSVGFSVPWHSNFRELRGTSEVVQFTDYVEQVLDGSLSPAGIFVETTEQARKVRAHLAPLVDSPNSGVKRIFSLADLLPTAMAAKARIIAKMHQALAKVQKKGLKSDDRQRLEKAMVLTQAKPWREQDIPVVFRRPFRAVDEQGQFVVVWPRSEMVEDTDIVAWGGELNRIREELRARGLPAKILGENRIGARVLTEMRSQAPVIMIAAALAVLVILIHDTRSLRSVLLIAGSLGVGVVWMLGVMHLMGLEINVFNQAVLATVIGLGLDNAVHVQYRYAEEGRGSLPKVVATTGAASFLATATTAIGFGAAVTASHAGVQSLGWLALVGFSCTFISSTIFFPAVLRILECASPMSRNSGEPS